MPRRAARHKPAQQEEFWRGILRRNFGDDIVDGRYPAEGSPVERRDWLDRRLNYLWSITNRTENESVALTIASRRMTLLLERFPELPTSGCESS